MAKDFNKEDGVWRTIGGRRVFIRKGQSMADAMKESGKFKRANKEEKKEDKKDHTFEMNDEEKKKYEAVGKKIDDLTKEIEEQDQDPYNDPESEESQRLQDIQRRYDDYLQKTEGRGASYGEIAYVDNLRGKDLDDFEKELDDFEENDQKKIQKIIDKNNQQMIIHLM